MILLFILLAIVQTSYGAPKKLVTTNIPDVTTNWVPLQSSNGIKFTPRNAHASCIFKKEIWLTGGKTDLYTMFNLQPSYKASDVWHSADGALWEQVVDLKGDFWAQNDDVLQPGRVAPWYARFGHSLNAIDLDGDNEDDIMVLMGGYSPEPSNDIWVSEDGVTWIYCGYANWGPRAWHATTEFNHTLWVAGGSPLNNEVWRLDSVKKIENRRPPLTRSMYVNYTYSFSWTKITESAPWSPRVGMGFVSHWWFNASNGESYTDSEEYLVLIGGFGGWPDTHADYDGFHGRADVWITTNGYNWTLANASAEFGGRAWFGLTTYHSEDKRLSARHSSEPQSGEIYMFGGGDIGFSTSSTRNINSMDGRMDAYYSRDMRLWSRINYQEGGGTSSEISRMYSAKNLPKYSSQEWAKTTVDTITVYLGLWGMTVMTFNVSTGKRYPGEMFMVGGDYVNSGARSNEIYKSQKGLFCDVNGVACNYAGECMEGGCVCSEGFSGVHCEEFTVVSGAAGVRTVFLASVAVTVASILAMSLYL